MKKTPPAAERGNTLIVTLTIVATLLVLLGSAVGYTTHISRVSQRSRKSALAVEIADGHLEELFTAWRNISRIQVIQSLRRNVSVSAYALPTQYFFTDIYNPGPSPSPNPATTGLSAAPPIIPLPAKSLFPSELNYTISQYRIQAVTPMITLQGQLNPSAVDPEGSTVPVTDAGDAGNASSSSQFTAAFGPNTSTTNGQYSYYYLAAADVNVPTTTGAVTAKVRRVFEKKFDEPFTFALFFMDDLELFPTTSLKINGPVQTNASLYIGTSNFVAQTPTLTSPFSGKVGYATTYVNGRSPQDPTPAHATVSAPTFAPGMPPSTQPPYLPYGWNLKLDGTNANNRSYHELIEQAAGPDPVTGVVPPDDISGVRLYNQSDYRVLIGSGNSITITNKAGNAVTNGTDYKAITDALNLGSGAIDQTIIQDVREGGPVRVQSVDIGAITSRVALGMIYIADTTAGTPVTLNGYTTTKRAIRLRNGATIAPTTGLTFASPNPVYIWGDYNTGGTPPSNSGVYTTPNASGYTRRPCAIVADAVSVLSNAWSDTTAPGSRVASNTTINAAIITGNVASDGTHYSGGGENLIRLLENWTNQSFTYYGSMIQLWQSQQGTGFFNAANFSVPTNNNWFYDTTFATAVPPGNFQLAAYLQQQRWYQVY